MPRAFYPQHAALQLLPHDAMSDQDLAAHLVYDHGYDAVYLSDNGYLFVLDVADMTSEAAGPPAVAHFLAMSAADRAGWHGMDHDTDDGTTGRVTMDPDTGTWNDHGHYRSAADYAAAIASAAGTRESFDSDPGGWAAYIGDTELDSDRPEEEDVVALAAFEILAAPGFRWPE